MNANAQSATMIDMQPPPAVSVVVSEAELLRRARVQILDLRGDMGDLLRSFMNVREALVRSDAGRALSLAEAVIAEFS